jgi:hypothetical protein
MQETFHESLNHALAIINSSRVDTENETDLGDTNYWTLIDKLKCERESSISLVESYIKSRYVSEKILGITLSGQLCNPVNNSQEKKEALKIISWLTQFVHHELELDQKIRSKRCLIQAGYALGYPHLHQAQDPLLLLSKSKDQDIRLAATISLGSTVAHTADSEWEDRMIALSKDHDGDVRDWATLHLASIENPGIEVLDAIADRLHDENEDTVTEAIYGLAYHNDPRALVSLKKRLGGESVFKLDIESAGLYGTSELEPYLKDWEIKQFDKLLDWARKRCSSNSCIKNSVDDEWLDDEWYTRVLRGERPPAKYRNQQ